MKNKFLLIVLALFMAMPLFALTTSQGPELGEPGALIAWLSPVIIWVVGLVLKPLAKVPGWVMLTIVVPLLSFGTSWLLESLELTDLNFWAQFLYGLGAVFLDQVKKKIQEQIPT